MTHFLARAYLSLAEAASYCKVSPRTLRRWISSGLPAYQGSARGKLLLRMDDIDQFLTRRSARTDLDELVNGVLAEIRTAPQQIKHNGHRIGRTDGARV